MSAFTPGPWHVGAGGNFHANRVWSADMQPIVNMISFGASPADLEPIAQANARLISAAPDLLEACKTFAEWLRREDDGFVKAGNTRDTPEGEAAWRAWFDGNLDLCSKAQSQARAAIAKAVQS